MRVLLRRPHLRRLPSAHLGRLSRAENHDVRGTRAVGSALRTVSRHVARTVFYVTLEVVVRAAVVRALRWAALPYKDALDEDYRNVYDELMKKAEAIENGADIP